MEKKEDIQSRRQFFKKIGTKTLPFLGAVVLGPAISLTTLTSCGCDGCEAACMDNCEGGCVGSCQGSATSSPCSDCSSTCSGSSTNDTCSSCANNCSSSCVNSCTSGANNNGGGEAPDEISPASGKVDGYEYVDLGLSVKWARYNFGAQKPEDYGKLVADLDASGSGEKRYYYALTAPEIQDGDSICGNPKYDVATSQWSRNWCLPSKKNLDELLENTSYESVIINGVKGTKFISKKNGNSIFMPFAGHVGYSGSETYNNNYIGKRGYYWTGDIKELVVWTDPQTASFCKYELRINEDISQIKVSTERGHALSSVRPVTTGSGGGGGGCTGSSCSSNCANNSTSSGCTGCSTGCSTSCKTTCEGSCINGCNTLCGGQCRYSCGGTCSYVSAGNSCTSSTCATTCSSYCYRTCTMACSSSCQSQCIYGSK